MSQQISLVRENGVLTIKMNRPEKRNALTAEMYDAMREAVVGAGTDDAVGAIVLCGSGGSFSAGNDLSSFLAPRAGPFSDSPAAKFMKALIQNTKPLIAAVEGVAVGIGTTVLLHCDIVFASPDARFRLPFVDLGIVPEAGSSVLLPQLIGLLRASELLLTGRFFDAAEANKIGIVSHVVESPALLEVAAKAARDLATKPRTALLLTRSMLRGDPEDIANIVDREFAQFGRALASPETQARIAAMAAPRT